MKLTDLFESKEANEMQTFIRLMRTFEHEWFDDVVIEPSSKQSKAVYGQHCLRISLIELKLVDENCLYLHLDKNKELVFFVDSIRIFSRPQVINNQADAQSVLTDVLHVWIAKVLNNASGSIDPNCQESSVLFCEGDHSLQYDLDSKQFMVFTPDQTIIEYTDFDQVIEEIKLMCDGPED